MNNLKKNLTKARKRDQKAGMKKIAKSNPLIKRRAYLLQLKKRLKRENKIAVKNLMQMKRKEEEIKKS